MLRPGLRVARRWLPTILGWVLFAWCAWYLYSAFEWRQVLAILARTDPLRFFLGGSLTLTAYALVRSLRWWIMLRDAGREVAFADVYFATVVSIGVGSVTPVQSGEAIKVELLKKRGLLDRLPGYGSFVVERMSDLLVVLALAAVGVLFGPSLVPGQARLRMVLPIAAIALTLACLVATRLHPLGVVGRRLAWLRAAAGGTTTLVLVVLLTVLGWLMVAAGWWVSLASIRLHASAGQVLTLVPLVALARILSFLPGGLGVSEVLSAETLARMGHPVAMAQAGALILRCYSLLSVLNAALHLALWRSARPAPLALARAGAGSRDDAPPR